MSMHVNLSPEMERFIKGKVASGMYGNATEVIRDAIRRMQVEEERLQAWRAAVRAGEEELDRGEGVPYTPAALDEITNAAIGGQHGDEPISRDVLP
jgi:antitoxin ParD1/3/4